MTTELNITIPAGWDELQVHMFKDSGGVISHFDGHRHYTLASIEGVPRHAHLPNDEGQIRLDNMEIYPVLMQALFPEPVRRRARLITPEVLLLVWEHMRNLAHARGYAPALWAPAMMLLGESRMMWSAYPHGGYTLYTFEQCLALVARFHPAYSLQEIGILIDKGVPPEELLAIDPATPYAALDASYPSKVR